MSVCASEPLSKADAALTLASLLIGILTATRSIFSHLSFLLYVYPCLALTVLTFLFFWLGVKDGGKSVTGITLAVYPSAPSAPFIRFPPEWRLFMLAGC